MSVTTILSNPVSGCIVTSFSVRTFTGLEACGSCWRLSSHRAEGWNECCMDFCCVPATQQPLGIQGRCLQSERHGYPSEEEPTNDDLPCQGFGTLVSRAACHGGASSLLSSTLPGARPAVDVSEGVHQERKVDLNSQDVRDQKEPGRSSAPAKVLQGVHQQLLQDLVDLMSRMLGCRTSPRHRGQGLSS